MEDLKKKAEELGIKVDGRWSEDRLREEIERVEAEAEAARLAAEAEAQDSGSQSSAPGQVGIKVDFSDSDAFTVRNLQANPMRSLDLASYGERIVKVREGADEALMKKIQRGVELGLLEVVELE